MAATKVTLTGGAARGRTPPGTPTIRERWKAARAAGERTFDPGCECVNGHTSLRWTNNGICIECKRARDNAYNAAHKDDHRRRSRESAERRRDEVRAYFQRWAQENPHKIRANNAKRKARQFAVAVGDRKAYAVYVKWARTAPRVPCYWCKKPTRPGHRHIDHIIPIAKGGPDAVGNLCIACPPCNSSKRAKMPEEFAGQAELKLA